MEINLLTIGPRIRNLRISRNLSQTHMAIILSISKQQLSNIENGHRVPSLEILISISQHFHVSLDYLVFGYKDNPFDIWVLQESYKIAEKSTLLHQYLREKFSQK